jgi:hypothetical protein
VWAAYRIMRKTEYGNAYMVLAVGLTSLTVSYAYNRHVTERTFWLLLAVIFAAELFAERVRAVGGLNVEEPTASGFPQVHRPRLEVPSSHPWPTPSRSA